MTRDDTPRDGRTDGGSTERRRSPSDAASGGNARAPPTGGDAQQAQTAGETAADGAERLTVDPVTRISGGGSGALSATVDPASGTVTDSRFRATLFRGYESVLEGRDARDADSEWMAPVSPQTRLARSTASRASRPSRTDS